MCISSKVIKVLRGPNYVDQQVACGKCWQCRKSRVNDYVGRCLCELSTSKEVLVLTLTYRDRTENDLAEKVIYPPHFQKFVRALRDSQHSLRYLAAGEYGELKGRAHFHCILFLNSSDDALDLLKSQIPQKQITHIPQWPHGHVFGDWGGSESKLRYVCKYLLKPDELHSKVWYTLSKKPALGGEYFYQKALRDAEFGVMPHQFGYKPPFGESSWKYTMTGATRRDYLTTLIAARSVIYGKLNKRQLNEWVLRSVEKLEKAQHQQVYDSLPTEEQFTQLFNKLELERITEKAAAFQAAYELGEPEEEYSPFSYAALLDRFNKGSYSYSRLQNEVGQWLERQREGVVSKAPAKPPADP